MQTANGQYLPSKYMFGILKHSDVIRHNFYFECKVFQSSVCRPVGVFNGNHEQLPSCNLICNQSSYTREQLSIAHNQSTYQMTHIYRRNQRLSEDHRLVSRLVWLNLCRPLKVFIHNRYYSVIIIQQPYISRLQHLCTCNTL